MDLHWFGRRKRDERALGKHLFGWESFLVDFMQQGKLISFLANELFVIINDPDKPVLQSLYLLHQQMCLVYNLNSKMHTFVPDTIVQVPINNYFTWWLSSIQVLWLLLINYHVDNCSLHVCLICTCPSSKKPRTFYPCNCPLGQARLKRQQCAQGHSRRFLSEQGCESRSPWFKPNILSITSQRLP